MRPCRHHYAPEHQKMSFQPFQALNDRFYAKYGHNSLQVIAAEDQCELLCPPKLHSEGGTVYLLFALQQRIIIAPGTFYGAEGVLHISLPSWLLPFTSKPSASMGTALTSASIARTSLSDSMTVSSAKNWI